MSEIPDGKYLITSFLGPQPWVGADNDDDCAVKPVIIDGEMRKVGPLGFVQRQRCLYYPFKPMAFVSSFLYDWIMCADRSLILIQWSITDGKLVLEDNWYASADSKSVVVQTSVDPGTRWNFLRVDNGEPGWYLLVSICFRLSYFIADIYVRIRLANTNIAWTASNTKPKTRVRSSMDGHLSMFTNDAAGHSRRHP